MKKFSKIAVAGCAAAMALCGLALTSTASASSWGQVGSEHTLDTDFGLTGTFALGAMESGCNSAFFTIDVRTAADVSITSATFGGLCTAKIGATSVCNTTLVGTDFPWTLTAPTTATIQMAGVHIDMTFDQSLAGTCPAGLISKTLNVTGTINDGFWTPFGHEILFNNVEGLHSHSTLGANQPLTVRSAPRDTSQTLTLSG